MIHAYDRRVRGAHLRCLGSASLRGLVCQRAFYRMRGAALDSLRIGSAGVAVALSSLVTAMLYRGVAKLADGLAPPFRAALFNLPVGGSAHVALDTPDSIGQKVSRIFWLRFREGVSRGW